MFDFDQYHQELRETLIPMDRSKNRLYGRLIVSFGAAFVVSISIFLLAIIFNPSEKELREALPDLLVACNGVVASFSFVFIILFSYKKNFLVDLDDDQLRHFTTGIDGIVRSPESLKIVSEFVKNIEGRLPCVGELVKVQCAQSMVERLSGRLDRENAIAQWEADMKARLARWDGILSKMD